MNMKKTAKKIVAVLTGATMLGATVMGAMAMDLGHYPAPLIVDGVWDAKIVVGENAASSDTSGAASLAAGLAQYSGEHVAIGGGGIVLVDGYQDEFYLNQAFPAGNLTLDEADLPSFFDGTIRWDGKNIKVKEVLTLVDEAMVVRTNVGDDFNEDMGANPYLVFEHDTDDKYIVYGYEFNDDLDVGDIESDVGRTAINLQFLGRDLKIIDHDGGDLTVESYTLTDASSGDTVTTPEGHTITVGRITENLVEITVNGQTKWVGEDEVESFSAADWFEIEVDRIIHVDAGHPDNAVLLKYGEELDYIIENGEPATLFGESDRRTEAEWFWHVVIENNMLEFLGIVNEKERVDPFADRATERPAIGLGESVELPYGYAEIAFEGFMDDRYTELTIDFVRTSFLDDNEESTGNIRVIRLSAPEVGDAFQWDNEKESEIYLWYNGTAYNIGWDDGTDMVYEEITPDGDDKILDVKMNRRQDDVTLHFNESALGVIGLWFEFDGETPENLWFDVSSGGDTYHRYFGGDSNNEAEYAYYNVNDKALGRMDYDIKTSYGVVFEDPERQLERDSVVLKIPHEEMEAIVTVKTAETTVGGGAGGSNFVHVPVPPADVGVYDSEVMNLIGEVPMLVVGGPNANTVAANLLGVTAGSDGVMELFEPNKAMIKLFEEQQAILVAGYRAKDTRAASLALADFEANKEWFEGYTEVEVAVPGTSAESIVGK